MQLLVALAVVRMHHANAVIDHVGHLRQTNPMANQYMGSIYFSLNL